MIPSRPNMVRTSIKWLIVVAFLAALPQLAQAKEPGRDKDIAGWIKQLDDQDSTKRATPPRRLFSEPGRAGQSSAAVNKLLACLNDADTQVRVAAAIALGNIGDPASVALPKLAELLISDKETSVRSSAAIALGRIGSKAQMALPAILKALDPARPDDVCRQAVEGIASTLAGISVVVFALA